MFVEPGAVVTFILVIVVIIMMLLFALQADARKCFCDCFKATIKGIKRVISSVGSGALEAAAFVAAFYGLVKHKVGEGLRKDRNDHRGRIMERAGSDRRAVEHSVENRLGNEATEEV